MKIISTSVVDSTLTDNISVLYSFVNSTVKLLESKNLLLATIFKDGGSIVRNAKV